MYGTEGDGVQAEKGGDHSAEKVNAGMVTITFLESGQSDGVWGNGGDRRLRELGYVRSKRVGTARPLRLERMQLVMFCFFFRAG